MRRLLAAFALTLAASPAFAQGAPTTEPAPIKVTASLIDRFDATTPVGATFGKLIFLGGLRLTSSDPDFGGLSGLRLSSDGKTFSAISDRGNWFRGEIAYEGSKPVTLTGVTRASTPGRDGRPLPGRRGFDTEALEIDGTSAWVTAERVHWLTRYALDASGRPVGAGKAVALPRTASRAPKNSGYEAMARLPSGAIAIVAEDFLDDNGDNRAFVVGAKAPFAFAVKRHGAFMPTDMVRLPDGRLALLERRYRPIFSIAARIRVLLPDDIRPDAVVDGPELMQATLAQTIDNFEAIAVHVGADGATVLTILSDDNFSAIQRTLLLQFAIAR